MHSPTDPVILGIDVGTTYTAGALAEGDRVTPLTLGTRSFMIPSTVFIQGEEVVVGDAAERRALESPANVARGVKRRMGDDTPMIVAGAPWPPELLFARIQRWVFDQAKTDAGERADRVVLTHPATWGPFRLEVLAQAAQQAGIPEPIFVSEPEAAATFHATEVDIEPGGVVIVYDFGGGTFDAAVLRQEADGFVIVGDPVGIDSVGGLNVDEAVLRFVDESAGGVLADLDPDDTQVMADVAELRRRCILAKEALSVDLTATVAVRLPGVDDVDVRITRDDLRRMTSPIVGQTVVAVARAMASADVSTDEVQTLLLVGGSSLLPSVAELLNEQGLPVICHPNPKLAVCQGAAVYGRALLAPARTPAPPAPPEPAAPPAPAPEVHVVTSTAPAPPPAPVAQPVEPFAPAAEPVAPAPPRPEPVAPTPRSGGRIGARLAAFALLVLTVVIAFAGIGASTAAPRSATGLTIDRTVDLSSPLVVRFATPPAGAATVEVGVTVGPTSLIGSDRTPLTNDGTSTSAAVDLSGNRYLVAGKFDATVVVRDATGQLLSRETVPADTSGSGFLTVSGIVICVLLLVVIAVIETLLRSLRRAGRAAPTLVVRLVVVGAVLGALIVGFVWLLHGPQPTAATGVVCAVTAGLAALLVGLSPRPRVAT